MLFCITVEVHVEAQGLAAAQKPRSGKDAWGNRIGSDRAKLNRAVTSKWQSVDELMKKAGVRGKYRSNSTRHLETKARQGVVETDGRGNFRRKD
jgi:hypothetical protein